MLTITIENDAHQTEILEINEPISVNGAARRIALALLPPGAVRIHRQYGDDGVRTTRYDVDRQTDDQSPSQEKS